MNIGRLFSGRWATFPRHFSEEAGRLLQPLISGSTTVHAVCLGTTNYSYPPAVLAAGARSDGGRWDGGIQLRVVPLLSSATSVCISHPLEVGPVRCRLVVLSTFSRNSFVCLLLGPCAHLRFGTNNNNNNDNNNKTKYKTRCRLINTCVGEEGG